MSKTSQPDADWLPTASAHARRRWDQRTPESAPSIESAIASSTVAPDWVRRKLENEVDALDAVYVYGDAECTVALLVTNGVVLTALSDGAIYSPMVRGIIRDVAEQADTEGSDR